MSWSSLLYHVGMLQLSFSSFFPNTSPVCTPSTTCSFYTIFSIITDGSEEYVRTRGIRYSISVSFSIPFLVGERVPLALARTPLGVGNLYCWHYHQHHCQFQHDLNEYVILTSLSDSYCGHVSPAYLDECRGVAAHHAPFLDRESQTQQHSIAVTRAAEPSPHAPTTPKNLRRSAHALTARESLVGTRVSFHSERCAEYKYTPAASFESSGAPYTG